MDSNRKIKKEVIRWVLDQGLSKNTAVMVARCHLRREKGIGRRPSEWFCDEQPVAHYYENRFVETKRTF